MQSHCVCVWKIFLQITSLRCAQTLNIIDIENDPCCAHTRLNDGQAQSRKTTTLKPLNPFRRVDGNTKTYTTNTPSASRTHPAVRNANAPHVLVMALSAEPRFAPVPGWIPRRSFRRTEAAASLRGRPGHAFPKPATRLKV